MQEDQLLARSDNFISFLDRQRKDRIDYLCNLFEAGSKQSQVELKVGELGLEFRETSTDKR